MLLLQSLTPTSVTSWYAWHVDTVFEVFIFKFFSLVTFFMHVGVLFDDGYNFLNSGESSTKCPIWATTHIQRTRSFGIKDFKRWNTMRKKKKSATSLQLTYTTGTMTNLSIYLSIPP